MTQSIVVACSACGQPYKLAAEMLGRQFQCKKCGSLFVAGAEAQPMRALAPKTVSSAGFTSASAAPGLPASPQRGSAGSKLVLPLLLAGAGAAALLIVVALALVLFTDEEHPIPTADSTNAAPPALPQAAAIPSPPPSPFVSQPMAMTPGPAAPPAPPLPAPPSLVVAEVPEVAEPVFTDPVSTDPAEISQALIDQLVEKVRLIASVVDIESAQAVADRYPAVARAAESLEHRLRNRLVTPEQQQQLDAQYKARLNELRNQWAKEFIRVTSVPGAYENMDPDLAPHADLTPFPDDLDGLHREALRGLSNALTALQQVQDIETARRNSPLYRVANARSAPALSALRRKLKLGVNGRYSAEVEGLIKQIDVQRARIGKIPGAHGLLARGELDEPSPVATTRAAGVQSVTLARPPAADGFFAQNPQAIVVRYAGLQSSDDSEKMYWLMEACSPPFHASQTIGQGDFVTAPVTDLEGFLSRLDFADVAVDRSSRVVVLTPRYPLPEVSAAAVRWLIPELQSGDQTRVRSALGKLTNIKPGAGRDQIGAALLELLAIEPVRGSAVDCLRQGWFSHEQIPLIRSVIPTVADTGLQGHMVVGISKIPDLDQKVIAWISSFYGSEHHVVLECWQNIGPAAEPYVQEYLSHPQHDKRKDACKTLARIGSPASLPLLEKMLSDRDSGVIDEAKKAMVEIRMRNG